MTLTNLKTKIMATLVKFLRERDSKTNIFAWFPDVIAHDFYTESGQHIIAYSCYSHVGQHSSCNMEYVQRCKQATPAQYKPLKQELESIGYTLKICK